MFKTPFILALSLCAVTLAGCSMVPDDTRAAYEVTGSGSAGSQPMAQLPLTAGAVVSVVESANKGVITQKIVLKGDATTWGENGAVVVVDQSPDRPVEKSWSVPKPTEELIDKELRENFSDMDMGIGQTYTRNSFGPFGFAVGKNTSGITCLYAWQFSPGRKPQYFVDPQADAVNASTPVAPTSVRVRLCKQNVAEADLVAMVSQMSVFPPHSTTPYLDPTYQAAEGAAPDALAATGLPGGFYTGSKTASAASDATPSTLKPKHKKHHHYASGSAPDLSYGAPSGGALPPVIVPPLGAGASSVPMAGAASVPMAGAASADPAAPSGANPLTAPLHQALAVKKKAVDDLPLPGAPGAAAASAAAASPAPIPLPQ